MNVPICFRYSHSELAHARLYERNYASNVIGSSQSGGCVETAQHIPCDTLRALSPQELQTYVSNCRTIGSQSRGTPIDVCSVVQTDILDLIVVRRNHDISEASRLQGEPYRIGNNRVSEERNDVLAWEPFGTATCGNDGNAPHVWQRIVLWAGDVTDFKAMSGIQVSNGACILGACSKTSRTSPLSRTLEIHCLLRDGSAGLRRIIQANASAYDRTTLLFRLVQDSTWLAHGLLHDPYQLDELCCFVRFNRHDVLHRTRCSVLGQGLFHKVRDPSATAAISMSWPGE